MKIRTHHTALVQIIGHGSGGRGKVVVGHENIVKGIITSKYFRRYDEGSFVTVNMMASGTRRLIQSVLQEIDIESIHDFMNIYGGQLEQQRDKFNESYNLDGMDVTATVVVADGGEDESKEETPEKETLVSTVEWETKIFVSPENEMIFKAVKTISEKRHVAVMMVGPSGYGKTTIPEQKAKDWEMNFLRWDCATVRDPEEFFGFRGAKDGSTIGADGQTIFTNSLFTETLQAGNCVIVLDELNRIDPYISNILFPLLDHAGKTSVAGHSVQVGENVIFVATVNLGYQFTGTFTLDSALNNRFLAKILVGPLPRKIEEDILVARGLCELETATKIVKIMEGLRALNDEGKLSVDSSTRVSIQIAELCGVGLDVKSAMLYTIINGISKEEAKLVVDQVGIATSSTLY